MSFACRPPAGGTPIVSPLPGGTSYATRIGASCTVSLFFNSDGTVSATKTAAASWNTGPVAHNWFNPTLAGAGNAYWVRATINSGSLTSGTTGAWTSLASNQSWVVTKAVIGVLSCNMTIEIASDSGGANIVTSGSYTITAEFG